MDFLYVAKRVPYPLTVEVFGGAGYGKLQPGALNQPVALLLWLQRVDATSLEQSKSGADQLSAGCIFVSSMDYCMWQSVCPTR
jgi:hypothetical protein